MLEILFKISLSIQLQTHMLLIKILQLPNSFLVSKLLIYTYTLIWSHNLLLCIYFFIVTRHYE